MSLDSIEPLVSIGLPTFNGGKKIFKAIKSILNQNYRNIELIISDNASTDDTNTICNEYTKKDQRIKYFRQDHNIGARNNFPFVLEQSLGEYFMWLGDDDILDENYVSDCIYFYRNNRDYSLVCGRAMYWTDDKFVYSEFDHNMISDDPAKRVLEYLKHVGSNGVFYGIAPRKALNLAKNAPHTIGGDWLHVARLAFVGKVKTLNSCHIHRQISYRGQIENYTQALAQNHGFPDFQARFPHLSISISLFNDIVYSNGVYSTLDAKSKLALAQASQKVLCKKWGYKPKKNFLACLNVLAMWQSNQDESLLSEVDKLQHKLFWPKTRALIENMRTIQLVCDSTISYKADGTDMVLKALSKYICKR